MENKNYVDITKPTLISFCAGYGGLELGIERAIGRSCNVLAYSEIESFVVENLVAKMEAGLLPAAPIWSNLRTFPSEAFSGMVDILCGGFPCQPFSHAGKRAGDEDPRHLFPYIKRAAEVMRPGLIFLENVEGLLSAKLAGDGWADPAGTPILVHIFRELERVGYRCTAGIFSASEVGAPHQRKRVFVLGYDKSRGPVGFFKTGESERETSCGGRFDNNGEDVAHQLGPRPQGHAGDVHGEGREPGGEDRPAAEGGLPGGKTMGDAPNQRLCGGQTDGFGQQSEMLGQGFEGIRTAWPSRPGQAQYGWEPPRVVGNLEHAPRGENDQREPGDMEQEARDGRGGEDAAGGAGRGEIKSDLGLFAHGDSVKVGTPLTSTPLMGYNILRGDHANDKTRAIKILQELRDQIGSEEVRWTLRGLWCFFTEKVLQSELRMDVFSTRICFFIWATQTGNEVQGHEMPDMWLTEVARSSPQRQEPREQFQRELDYALCVLSYEIALERGKTPMERPCEMRDMRKWCEDAWVVSEALVPLTKIWKSTFNEESWADRAYFEAAGLGANRTDELRMCGSGCVPQTVEKAFRTLYRELSNRRTIITEEPI